MNQQIRVIYRLPQAREQVKNMCIIVHQRPPIHKRIELHPALHIDTLIKIPLLRGQGVLADRHRHRGQLHVRSALHLRAAQEDLVQELLSQQFHRFPPNPVVSKALNGVGNHVVEVRVVLGLGVPALPTDFLVPVRRALEVVVYGTAGALGSAAEEIGEGIHSQKSHEGKQLPDSILQRCAAQAPPGSGRVRLQCVRCLGGRVGPALDPVRLVQDNPAPSR
mmetsp:Transcript_21307/g.51595  ORF Transcript_21307/g.51595 Transcript_21307/m.51595 type:complete len:221 (+) Transcript_21307:904-1566(+)